MAVALFSKEPSSEKETPEEPLNLLAVVRTMEEDMYDVQHKGSVDSSSTEVQKTPPQEISASSKENKKLFQPQAETGKKQPGSPFGVPVQPKNEKISKIMESPSLGNGLSGVVPDGEMLTNQPKKSNMALWVSIILTLALIIGGLLYFYYQKNQTEAVTPPVSDTDTQVEITENVVPAALPFSLDKPNPVPFNVETVSPEEIKKVLSEIILRIKAAHITQPVEFFVTDQNNNPLAFSRFAFLLKLNLDSDTLALINETFSLYAFSDAESMRLGLGLTFRDGPSGTQAITKIETNLPFMFQSLTLEPGVNTTKTNLFKSTPYSPKKLAGKEVSIRYSNVNIDKNVSFDYTLYGAEWFIGTSKNTLRAILDTYVK